MSIRRKQGFHSIFQKPNFNSVLDKIEEESEFFFLYNEKLLDTERKVSISANNQLINVILDDLFAGTDVNIQSLTERSYLHLNILIKNQRQMHNNNK